MSEKDFFLNKNPRECKHVTFFLEMEFLKQSRTVPKSPNVEEKNLVKFLELQNLNFYIIVAQNRKETS